MLKQLLDFRGDPGRVAHTRRGVVNNIIDGTGVAKKELRHRCRK